jgi:hypothetical protein
MGNSISKMDVDLRGVRVVFGVQRTLTSNERSYVIIVSPKGVNVVGYLLDGTAVIKVYEDDVVSVDEFHERMNQNLEKKDGQRIRKPVSGLDFPIYRYYYPQTNFNRKSLLTKIESDFDYLVGSKRKK